MWKRLSILPFRPEATLALIVAAFVIATGSLAAVPQTDALIRSTTRLVQMSVVAVDKQGRPVRDLKQTDFDLFDNGKHCPVSVFVIENATLKAAPPLPPHTFTNQLERLTGARSGYAVVLLDWLNTQWSDQVQARRQVVQMLGRIESSNRIALYVLDQGLRVITEFSADKQNLPHALMRLRGDPGTLHEVSLTDFSDASVALPPSVLGRPVPSASAGAIAGREEQIFRIDRRVHDTVQAFEEIADHMATVPGRKILIWVSAGFPLGIDSSVVDGAAMGERKTYGGDVQRAIEKLNDADVAVYPVDARGLSLGSAADITIETMKEFASHTGGVAWYNRNDLDAEVRAALDDLRFTYTLGFYPPSTATPGYHKLRVQTDRPGVKLRYRAGYDLGGTGESPGETAASAIVGAFESPVDLGAIPLTVRVEREPGGLLLRLSVDTANVDFVRHGDRWQAKLEINIRFAGANGQQVGSIVSQTAECNLRERTYRAALRDGLNLHMSLQVPPTAAALKQLVRDVSSGRIGTVTIPLATVSSHANRFLR